MDKLQPQTVYVPVGDKIRPDILTDAGLDPVEFLEKLTGVYPLTGKELAELLCQFKGTTMEKTIAFLKSKGVEI